MARIDSMADIGKLTRRKRMKSNRVLSGTMRRWRKAVSLEFKAESDRDVLRSPPANPGRNDQPCQRERGEDRRQDTDAERHRKTPHGARPDEEQHAGGNKRRDVGIKNGCERAREPGINGRAGRTASADFLADSLIDDHVAVDGNSDR